MDDFRLVWSRNFTDTLKWPRTSNILCNWRKRDGEKLNPNNWCNQTLFPGHQRTNIQRFSYDFMSETALFVIRRTAVVHISTCTRTCLQWVPGLFPGGKAAGKWRWPSAPHPAPRLTKQYFPSGPSWPVIEWNLHVCVASTSCRLRSTSFNATQSPKTVTPPRSLPVFTAFLLKTDIRTTLRAERPKNRGTFPDRRSPPHSMDIGGFSPEVKQLRSCS